ncbi:MAG: GHKL domain-containing protein [Cytophagales bacterium]|nr:MAG: GHKL domain-containing protein [Cytophagales bacterium]
MKSLHLIYIFCFLLLNSTKAQEIFIFNQTKENKLIGKHLSIFIDQSNQLGLKEVIKSNDFKISLNEAPNLGIGNNNYWVKFKIKNTTNFQYLILSVPYPILDDIDLFEINSKGEVLTTQLGDQYVFSKRIYQQTDFLFNISIPTNQTNTYYLKIKSGEQILLPILIGTPENIIDASFKTELIFSVYLGIVITMALYNLFLFFLIRDRSYLYYVVYIFFIGITQATLYGYPFKYLWPDLPNFSNHTIIIFPALAGLSAIQFTRHFLHTKIFTPRLDKGLFLFAGAYLLAVVLKLAGFHQLSFKIIDINALLLCLYCFIYTIIIINKGFKPAKYFIIAWSVFLLSIIIFVLRNLGILPYNDWTNYSVLFGTSFETITLSLALAARINELKKDKERSQANMLLALQENERIVKEQNITLEHNVKTRTLELSNKNQELNKALITIKNTQVQLIESEKMASLGQLTAGIAHEINNPINFVTSSVVPLKRDIDFILKIISKYELLNQEFKEEHLQEINQFKIDIEYEYLKEEINIILQGIEEGANRTAEIIRGLRNFSRLDEGGLKKVDLHSGLDSTLLLLNSSIRDKINIIKNYGNIPSIECQAGKINQVFMNLLSNAIHAVKEKHQNENNGEIKISTWEENNEIVVSIKDNGTGMTQETKNKIFEPFFTTKGSNEGTGLGLSIVQSALETHKARLSIVTELDKGSEFILYLPLDNF